MATSSENEITQLQTKVKGHFSNSNAGRVLLKNMTTQEQFEAAVKVIKSLPKNGNYQPSDELRLKFYGLYKQATVGENRTPRPGFWDLVARYKWDAWKQQEQMSSMEAMRTYVDHLKTIVETMSYSQQIADFYDVLGPFVDCGHSINGKGPSNGEPKRNGTGDGDDLNRTESNGMNGTGNSHSSMDSQNSNAVGSIARNGNDGSDQSEGDSDAEFSDTFDHMSNSQHDSLLNDINNGGDEYVVEARGESDAPGARGTSGNRMRPSANRANLQRGLAPNSRLPQTFGSLSGSGGSSGGQPVSSPMTVNAADEIALAVLRLQQSIEEISTRLKAIENNLNASKKKSYLTESKDNWWPSAISPSTVVFLVGWPFVVQYLVSYMKERRKK